LPAWTYQPQPPASSLPPQVYSAAPDNTYQQPGATERVPAVPYPAEPENPRKPGRAQEVMVPPAPKPDARPADLARAALAKGDYESAAGSYEDAIMQGEDTAENHQQLAICLDSLGRKSAAVSHLQRALQLYTERKSKGRDVAAAEAGIKACQDHLALLRD
jgi:tetratricopeptide (TPR) repeat protein